MHGASPAMSGSLAASVFANTLSNTLCWNTRVTIADAGVCQAQRHRRKATDHAASLCAALVVAGSNRQVDHHIARRQSGFAGECQNAIH